MPKRLKLSLHASTQELEHRYKKARDPVERSHLQIVWLLSEGRTTEEVCRVTGYSPGWVRRLARRYNERGWRGSATAATEIPAPGRGRCSTRRGKHSFERRSVGHRRLPWAGGCGAGRRWRA